MNDADRWKRLNLNGTLGLVRVSSVSKLKVTDAVLFDCDGVLIDSHESYDRTIELVTAHFLFSIFGLKMSSRFPTYQLIDAFRSTGQFNNDIDTVAAILVGVAATFPTDTSRIGTLQKAFDSPDFARRVLGLVKMASDGFSSFLLSVRISHSKSAAWIDKALNELAYPGGPAASRLARIFDEYFYGPELFRKLHGLASITGRASGLIDAEKAIVSMETLESLASRLPKERIGIVSGRSRLGTEHTLRELSAFFRDGPLIFLEDHDARLGTSRAILGKPNPQSLLLAAGELGNSGSILYVGDSMEDLMMTQNANKELPIFMFCGTTHDPARTSMLADHGADAIIHSVNDLPALLLSLW